MNDSEIKRKQKFLLVSERRSDYPTIRIGIPFYHRDLISEREMRNGMTCLGGGLWYAEPQKKNIVLYGSSDEFGTPEKSDINKAVKYFSEYDWDDLGYVCESWYKSIMNTYLDVDFIKEVPSYKFDLQY